MVSSSDSEDSEDSLLSLDEIQPWRRSQGKCSPLKSDRKGSHATATQDRRHSNRKHKSRSDSKVTVETFVRQQHGSSIANGQSKRGHDKQRSENATQRRSEEPHPDDRNPVAASAEGRSSQPQASTLSGPVTPYEMDTVPDSETEEDQDLEKHFDRLQIQAPPLHSSIFSQERSAPLSVEPLHRQEARSLADLLFPSTEATPVRVDKSARKARRLTVIVIPSDSEDEDRAEANDPSIQPTAGPSSIATSTPVPVGTAESHYEASTHDDASFADYSDDDNDEHASPSKGKGSAVIDLDSSDSEYDRAAGVLTWMPTPNKVRTLASSPRKPLSTIGSSSTSLRELLLPQTPSAGERDSIAAIDRWRDLRGTNVFKDITNGAATGSADFVDTPLGKKTPRKAPATASPRKGRKPTAKQLFVRERDEMARKLIQELDEKVFDGRLPSDINIIWNGRLNTTAGRASWKKVKSDSAEKVYQSSIELATKVVDCESKLNNTLSHEICHIAAWAIDKEMKPPHGSAFKHWGRKIMKVRKDISVTTKHTYEIAYKYQWQCVNAVCAKIYGRHSKSIDPTKHACGVCASKLQELERARATF